jgi:hypothetical protein
MEGTGHGTRSASTAHGMPGQHPHRGAADVRHWHRHICHDRATLDRSLTRTTARPTTEGQRAGDRTQNARILGPLLWLFVDAVAGLAIFMVAVGGVSPVAIHAGLPGS